MKRMRIATVGLAVMVFSVVGAEIGAAQEPPDVTPRVEAVAQSLERVAGLAEVGEWQAADAAFNDALDAIDQHRTVIESALGEPAAAAFGRLDGLIPDLVSALDAEDATGVRAMVAIALSELGPLAPGVPELGAAAEAQAILDWRAAVETILALADVSAWRDMRNAAMELTDDIERRGPAVAAAAGTDGARAVDVARVFAMRLRAAALDQSEADGRVAAGFLMEALDDLTRGIEGAPPAAPTARPTGGVVARAFIVDARQGGQVVVPVVLEDVPQIGLGGMDLSVRYSPRALRLLDVEWDVGEGSVVRDDVAGRVDLSLPQAPVGPAGAVVLGQLGFEVLSAAMDPRDYLPADEVMLLETAAGEARRLAARGDTPRAAGALSQAYVAFMAGRGRSDSLYESLAAHGLAAPLAGRLLTTLDLASRPAETDRIVVALRDLEELMTATWSSHIAALGGASGIPIQVVVGSLTDTSGQSLPVAEPLPGLVRLPEGAVGVATEPARGSTATPEPTGRPSVAPTVPPASPIPPVMDATEAAGGLPVPLVAALLLAGVAGVAAVLWADRRARDEGGVES